MRKLVKRNDTKARYHFVTLHTAVCLFAPPVVRGYGFDCTHVSCDLTGQDANNGVFLFSLGSRGNNKPNANDQVLLLNASEGSEFRSPRWVESLLLQSARGKDIENTPITHVIWIHLSFLYIEEPVKASLLTIWSSVARLG